MTSSSDIRRAWLAQLLSTDPADRTRAEAAVRRLYSAARFPEPRHFLWFDSPFEASWVVALLIGPYHHLWRDRLSSSALSRDDKKRVERARSMLTERSGIADVNAAMAAVGAPRGMHLQFPPDTRRIFSAAFLEARYSLVDDVSALFKVPSDDDDLDRAEAHFIGGNKGVLRSAIHCPTTDSLIGASFFADYSFSHMADDDERAKGRTLPPVIDAAFEVARSSGLWWPFENAVIMSDRPAELYVNERKVPHREDGPAVVYRNGDRGYAWNGKAVFERWILKPESIPPREIKGFDPTFRKFVESKASTSPAKTKEKAKRPRAGAGGPSFFDRYRAGEHRQVWSDLVALGSAVRDEPYAADARAVATETMRRVEANVRTLVDRLAAIGYVFTGEPGLRKTTVRPHVPPPSNIQKTLAAFEKESGAMPLSLRAFYEIVGEVGFIGHHPTLAPKQGPIAPDPLVVYGFDEGAVEYDDEDDSPSAITIAPDDLHKANISGGAAYEIAIPDQRADGELLNERHNLFFVDYLRLCFRFGGFPGWEGRDGVPAEIATLSAGLIEF